MNEQMEKELDAEFEFNAQYLLEKYQLDNIIIMGGKTDETGYGTNSYYVMKGSMPANIEACRERVKRTENTYDDFVSPNYFEPTDEGDEEYD